ncbi:hydroxyproline-rich glycoprotein family protein [Actinidia rufa]|uniref:Hydroxyproline-rich glycoprotein family protein n=1 Tax=Actinidia rufa TaxID=165716 RepID=A0A7J0G0L7_9ERIC|nr:hydroxyproline-rich glycoprotein family protein [Actinidia rufa]
MEENGEDVTPFWLQSTNNHRRHRRLLSFFLSSGLLLFLLCGVAFLFMFFVIPSILSLTTQIFRPISVKKSWDSLNLVLVLFALVFGFLSRNRNYDSRFDEDHRNVAEIKANPSTPHQWYEGSDRTAYSGLGGLRRNSSSYPDLREVSPWVNADDRWRFSDDTQLDDRRSSDSDHLRHRRSWKRVQEEEGEEESDRIKTVHVDTLVTRTKHVSYSPPLPPSSPLPPPRATALHRKPKRTYESVAQVKGSEPTKTIMLPAVTTPPPPPPPVDWEKKSGKSDGKRSGGNATKEFLTSLYHQKKKKKKQRQKSVENFETLIQPQAPISFLPSPSPPPPPPPPPPPLFPNLFSSKKGKSKKILTVPPPPPPPPPPVTTARASKTTAQIAPMASREPPLPVKIRSFSTVEEENSNSGGESPRIPIPPPPPPPFKMPCWRFVVKGDYVKVGSMNSSRSGSPDHSDCDESPTSAVDSGKAMAPLFCPSPDVNSKAEMFIAKFRAGLKLQKMNSIKQKEGLGLSKLGPETKPGPGPGRSQI